MKKGKNKSKKKNKFRQLPSHSKDKMTFDSAAAVNELLMLAKCPRCGSNVSGPDDNYCPKCGQALLWPSFTEEKPAPGMTAPEKRKLNADIICTDKDGKVNGDRDFYRGPFDGADDSLPFI